MLIKQTGITVLIDTREQCPLLFPSSVVVQIAPGDPYHRMTVATRRMGMKAGDYTVEGYGDIVRAERKGSVMEIHKNLCNPKDIIRQGKAFRLLETSCKYPILLFEESPAEILSTRAGTNHSHPEVLLSKLAFAGAKHKMTVLCLSKPRSVNGRRQLGTWLLHYMIGYIIAHEKEERKEEYARLAEQNLKVG